MFKKIELANGNTVRVFSFFPFTLGQIADVLRPVVTVPAKKTNKFVAILPWILVALMAVGLGVSGYFNWKQDRSYTYLKDNYNQMQSASEEAASEYYALRGDNDKCQNERYTLEQNNADLNQQIDQLWQKQEQMMSSFDSLSNLLSDAKDAAQTANSKSYDLYSDKYYSGTNPSADQLNIVNDYAAEAYRAAGEASNYLADLLQKYGR